MQTVWALLAQYKVPIVLNGHDHDYQRWEPLDGKGNPSPDGTTEFVAGGGGHGLTDFIKTDSRVAYSNSLNPTAFGVLLLQLDASGANFSYHSSDGSVLDSGYVPCSQSGTVAVTKASQTALSLAITPTLADPPANTPDPTDVATLAAAPTRTLVPTETPVEVGEVPSSPYKSPVFTGAITLGGFSIVVIITGLILLFRRRN
jgi:hypothetical protein